MYIFRSPEELKSSLQILQEMMKTWLISFLNYHASMTGSGHHFGTTLRGLWDSKQCIAQNAVTHPGPFA